MSLGLYISDHRQKFVYFSTHRVSGCVTAINISIFKNRSLSLVLITSRLPSRCQGVRVLGRTRAQLAGYCLLTNCLQVLSPAARYRQAQWHYWWFTISDRWTQGLFLAVQWPGGCWSWSHEPWPYFYFSWFKARLYSTSSPCLYLWSTSLSVWNFQSHRKDAWAHALEVLVPFTIVLVFVFLQNMRNHLPNETWWSAVLTTLWWSCQWNHFCLA